VNGLIQIHQAQMCRILTVERHQFRLPRSLRLS
jgi:hypothetical protein